MREAAVMLIVKDGLMLGVSRRYDATKFGLPGGKCEEGEAPIDAAIRETFEETGIKVSKCTFLYKRVEPAGVPNGFDFHAYCFYADEWSGSPVRSEEGEVKWVDTEELLNGAFSDYNRNTLKIFGELYPNVTIK